MTLKHPYSIVNPLVGFAKFDESAGIELYKHDTMKSTVFLPINNGLGYLVIEMDVISIALIMC